MRFRVEKNRIVITPENHAESSLLQRVQLVPIVPHHGSALFLTTPLELDASAPEVSNLTMKREV